MSLILLRHGEKKFANNRKPKNIQGYSCDPGLLNGFDVEKTSKYLPKFERIISSPFLRCRETSEIVCQYRNISDFSINPRLREYLGNQRGRGCQLAPKTLSYLKDYQIIETFPEFEERVLSILDEPFVAEAEDGANILLVGHSLVFRILIEELTKEIVELEPAEFYVVKFKESLASNISKLSI